MLTPAAVSEVRRAVRAALALEVGLDQPDRDEPARRARWRWRGQVPEGDFLTAVERHRVAPLLADHADDLGLAGTCRRGIVEQRDRERLGALEQIRLTAEVNALLAGIDHLLVKGVALATQTTGDPAARGGGDVDVLVSPDRVGDAAAALVAEGWTARRTYTSDQASWAWRYQRWGAHEMAFDRGDRTVDLHWRLDPTYDGLPGFADLWARRASLKVGPVEVDTLGPADALTHSLHHAAKDGWESLRSLVDVHRLAHHPGLGLVAIDRVGRATLSVVDATIGLPDGAPAFDRTAAPLPRVLEAQASPVRDAVFPGQRTMRSAHYRWAASRSPRDLGVNAVTFLLPPASTAGVADPRAITAVPRSIGARLRQVGWKVSGWRLDPE